MRRDASAGAMMAWGRSNAATEERMGTARVACPEPSRETGARATDLAISHTRRGADPRDVAVGGDARFREEEAFASVHDLVHYAIVTSPARRASLKQIYHVCTQKGRIAAKHGKGSRHLTTNEHWKSQIRHALYTSPRFCRAEEGGDDWEATNKEAPAPSTTTVRVYPEDEVPTASSNTGGVRAGGRPKKPKRGVVGGSKATEAPDEWKGPSLGMKAASSMSAGGGSSLGGALAGGGKRRKADDAKVSEPVDAAATAQNAEANSPARGPSATFAPEARVSLNFDVGFGRPVPPLVSRCGSPETPPEKTGRFDGERKPATVMVGDKEVIPLMRDPSVNRRKPPTGHRAALPPGSVIIPSPIKAPPALERQVSNAFITYHTTFSTLAPGLSLRSHEGDSPGTWIRGLLESQPHQELTK